MFLFITTSCSINDESATQNQLYQATNPAPCASPRPETVYFGEYPQTLASNDAVNQMRQTPEGSGYYISDYDNEQYQKVIGHPYYDNQYTFTNGDTIFDGDTYYFKVEPILWRILDVDQYNTALLLSELILDFTAFDDSINDWVVSDLRDFLNTQFYDSAFSTTEQSHIEEVTLENALTVPPIVTSSQPSTLDQVFLLSYKDMVTTPYRFNPDPRNLDCERRGQTSDFARSRGGIIHSYDQEFGFAFWWLRSAGGTAVNQDNPVSYVGHQGDLWWDAIYSLEEIGVRPSITIDLVHVKPNIIGDNDALFGEYPQTIASPLAVSQMGTSLDSDGYYTSAYDQARYAKLTATPAIYNTFSDGTPIVVGQDYYFKVEPVKWLILYNGTTNRLLITEYILDTEVFDSQDLQWANSDLRDFITQDVYTRMFTPSHGYYIEDTQLDNKNTNYVNSPSFTDTVDQMFLLSFIDSINTSYGFGAYDISVMNRTSPATDYAIAKGVYVDSHHFGHYWLRSNGANIQDLHCVVMFDGMVDIVTPKNSMGIGIRPSIWIIN